MSRNFELLKRIEEVRGVSGMPPYDLDGSNGDGRTMLDGGYIAENASSPEVTEALVPELTKLAQTLFVHAENAPRVVVFADVEARNPNRVCGQTGEVLRKMGLGSVCLVDANIESPTLNEMFGVDNTVGLVDALQDSGPIRGFGYRVAESRTCVVPAGRPVANWDNLISSPAMASRIADLRRLFDYVLIQAPPITTCPQASILARLGDGLVMTVEAESTPRDVARKAKQELESLKVPLLGAVLYNRTFPIPDSVYSRLR